MRWKAYYFLNPNKNQEQERITYGFKSRHHPPRRAELEEFEKDAFNIVKVSEYPFKQNKNVLKNMTVLLYTYFIISP